MDQDESDADNRSVQDQLPDALEGLKRQPAEDLLHCLLWDLGRVGYEAALRGDEQTVNEWACLQRSRPRSARRRRLLSVEELAERRTASEAILGLIELPDVESILGADSDELLRRMTGPEMPPPAQPTIWLPPRGTWGP